MFGMVYLDTDAFRLVADAFLTRELRADLRDRMALSPITVIELMSQLSLSNKGAQMLGRIHALWNLLNHQKAAFLPWMDAAIAKIGFGVETSDETNQWYVTDLQTCLNTNDAAELMQGAAKLKGVLDRLKDDETNKFQQVLDQHRNQPFSDDQLKGAFVTGLERMVGVKTGVKSINDVVNAMSAYFEFEDVKLKEHARNPQFRVDRNDILDVEQLVYLEDTRLHFLTCNRKDFDRVKNSPQAQRIHKVPHSALQSPNEIEALFERITA